MVFARYIHADLFTILLFSFLHLFCLVYPREDCSSIYFIDERTESNSCVFGWYGLVGVARVCLRVSSYAMAFVWISADFSFFVVEEKAFQEMAYKTILS